MSKRPRDEEQERKPAKRPKTHTTGEPPQVEEINFARQLQGLLAFRQDGLQQLRHGIASFKAFLDSVLYEKSEDDRGRKLSILREFLDTEKPKDPADTEQPFLGQLWQAWSFANENHNDGLVSSVSAILALLLKTLSSLLEFREHGLLLCRAALQHQHLRLIKRCLEAPKQKDFLISPCLRLLIEITSFDGGVLAREVYKRREQSFDIATLRRNLGLVKSDVPADQLQRRPSIRTWTVRYILAHLKYLHEGGKIDLLKSRPLCAGLFQRLRDDPPDLINELLTTIEQYVLKDNELPRSAKSALLAQQNLERVTEVATRIQIEDAVAEKALTWLKAVCTNPSYGLFRPSGWYPPGTTNANDNRRDDKTIDLGLDSIEFYDRDDRPDVRNTNMLSWIQTLRPNSNLQERELVLTCFVSAPELVVAYFADKVMQLEPKLSNTWIGYASFLFEAVGLPVPEYFGNGEEWAGLPPQTNVMIESVLPRPLTQKVLTRCLNQPSELVTFFVVRLLVLAFQKMSSIRNQLAKAAGASDGRADLWTSASEKLLTRFINQCPQMKDVIGAFRKTPDDAEHALQREALTRLLRLYHEVTPLLAMEEQFDISIPLTAALVRTESIEDLNEVSEIRALELEHLLQIARYSPGVRWFSKQGSLDFSPILTLIKIHEKDVRNLDVRELIYHVLSESGVLSSTAACDALVASLSDIDFAVAGAFLDDCFVRATRKPVKYLDDLEGLASSHSIKGDVDQHRLPSLLVAVLLEQAPFVLNGSLTEKDALISWVNSYIELLIHTDERCVVLERVQNSIVELDGWDWEPKYEDANSILRDLDLSKPESQEVEKVNGTTNDEATIPFNPPPVESDDHPELFKWAKKDLAMALEEGDIEALMLCLCSQHLDVRAQARTQLHKLESLMYNSTIDDKDAIYVLIGEFIETYEHHCLPKSEAVPCLVGTFATNALKVQIQPTHFMYPKINGFLNKGPEWRIHKLTTYWIDNTILAQPEEDDTYWKEALWVLAWLVDGLRSLEDLELLRRAGVFERVLSLCDSPGAKGRKGVNVKERVLELLWRATFVVGGSTTLITRTGVLAWLEMVAGDGDSVEKTLRKRILETRDVERVEAWSGLTIHDMMNA